LPNRRAPYLRGRRDPAAAEVPEPPRPLAQKEREEGARERRPGEEEAASEARAGVAPREALREAGELARGAEGPRRGPARAAAERGRGHRADPGGAAGVALGLPVPLVLGFGLFALYALGACPTIYVGDSGE